MDGPYQSTLFRRRKYIPDVFQHKPPIFDQERVTFRLRDGVGHPGAAMTIRTSAANAPEGFYPVKQPDFGLKAGIVIFKPDGGISRVHEITGTKAFHNSYLNISD